MAVVPCHIEIAARCQAEAVGEANGWGADSGSWDVAADRVAELRRTLAARWQGAGQGRGARAGEPYLDQNRINRASSNGGADGIPEKAAISLWRNVFNTQDGRIAPEGKELGDAGDGWSYQLAPSEEPRTWHPVARWDLPDPDVIESDELETDRGAGQEPAGVSGHGSAGPGEVLPPGVPKRPSYCGRWTAVGELRNRETGERTGEVGAVRIMCSRYLCPVCGRKRGAKTRRAVEALIERRQLCRMLTLTLDPAAVEASGLDPHRYLKRCFDRLRYRWRKAYRAGVQYVAVVEHHRSGMPHMHLAVSRYMPRRVVQRWWVVAGGGPQVWISYRDPGRAGRYVAKYLTKQLMGELSGNRFPLRVRRVQVSRGVRLFPPPEGKKGWRMIRASIDAVAAAAAGVRQTLDGMIVRVDSRRRLEFLKLPSLEQWQVTAFLLGIVA